MLSFVWSLFSPAGPLEYLKRIVRYTEKRMDFCWLNHSCIGPSSWWFMQHGRSKSLAFSRKLNHVMALISSTPSLHHAHLFLFPPVPCVQSHSRTSCVSWPNGQTIKPHKNRNKERHCLFSFCVLIPSLKDNMDQNLWNNFACYRRMTIVFVYVYTWPEVVETKRENAERSPRLMRSGVIQRSSPKIVAPQIHPRRRRTEILIADDSSTVER